MNLERAYAPLEGNINFFLKTKLLHIELKKMAKQVLSSFSTFATNTGFEMVVKVFMARESSLVQIFYVGLKCFK